MPQNTFNHYLLQLARQYRDKSQAEVAAAAGLNQGHYSRIENGLLPDGPSEDNVRRIADTLSFPRPSFTSRIIWQACLLVFTHVPQKRKRQRRYA